jgi:hypothetical protein
MINSDRFGRPSVEHFRLGWNFGQAWPLTTCQPLHPHAAGQLRFEIQRPPGRFFFELGIAPDDPASRAGSAASCAMDQGGCWPRGRPAPARDTPMNNIIYIIGLIVVVLAILAFFGLR